MGTEIQINGSKLCLFIWTKGCALGESRKLSLDFQNLRRKFHYQILFSHPSFSFVPVLKPWTFLWLAKMVSFSTRPPLANGQERVLHDILCPKVTKESLVGFQPSLTVLYQPSNHHVAVHFLLACAMQHGWNTNRVLMKNIYNYTFIQIYYIPIYNVIVIWLHVFTVSIGGRPQLSS